MSNCLSILDGFHQDYKYSKKKKSGLLCFQKNSQKQFLKNQIKKYQKEQVLNHNKTDSQ